MMTKHDLSGVTIVMIDDQPDNLIPLTFVLTRYAATVRVAQEGEQALGMIDTAHPDLVLLDLSMPGMNGWDMLKAIRANPATASLRVIAVTAHAMQTDRERALEAGFDGFISKPFRPSRVVDELMAYLPARLT
jgi:CheY-like chemotaxis protein